MMQQNPSSPPRPPQRYWDDSQWAIQNIQRLTASFPNEWVAVFNKQVVAHHTNLDQVLTLTQSTGLNSPVIKFIERGIRVYNLADVSNELLHYSAKTSMTMKIFQRQNHHGQNNLKCE